VSFGGILLLLLEREREREREMRTRVHAYVRLCVCIEGRKYIFTLFSQAKNGHSCVRHSALFIALTFENYEQCFFMKF